jgi:glycosyltransferase involved in cell wall biosynthesis
MDNNIPEISVIVPVYNAQDSLRQCVDSILSQSILNIEVILVDDGSSDDSPQICDDYASLDSRITVIHQVNKGVSAARNAALDIAKAKWITFIDSDDYVEPGFLENVSDAECDLIIKQYKKIINHKVVEQDICGAYSRLINAQEIGSFISKYITTTIFRGPCSKFYKRDLIHSLRFNTKMRVAEDSCFVFSYLQRINSLSVINDSRYIILIPTFSGNIRKYNMDIKYAKVSLSYLFPAYKALDEKYNIGPYGFNSYFSYFKEVSKNDWDKHPYSWYCDPFIKDLYKYIWQDMSVIQKCKYLCACMCFKIIHF